LPALRQIGHSTDSLRAPRHLAAGQRPREHGEWARKSMPYNCRLFA